MRDEGIEQVAADLQVAVGRLVRRLRQTHVPGGLTLSEASVLSRLDRDGPAPPGELATGERVRPQAMGVTLQRLEQRGLVSRTPDPTDGRRVHMAVTERGRQLLLDRRSLKTQLLAEAIAGFTEDEQRAVAGAARLLDRLAAAL